MARIGLAGFKTAVQAALKQRVDAIVLQEADKAAQIVHQRIMEEAANLAVNLVEQMDSYNFKSEVSIVLHEKES